MKWKRSCGKVNKLLSLMTICRKAGQLSMGFDPMKEALAEGKASAVIIASDISPKTEKEVRYFADRKKIPVEKVQCTIDEIHFCIGKKAGILTICGEGFAKKALELCKIENANNFTE